MKTRILIIVVAMSIFGILIFTSGVFTPLYSNIGECYYVDSDDTNEIKHSCKIIDGWYDVLFEPELSLDKNAELEYDLRLQECANLFNDIYEEFKSQPSCDADLPVICEPRLFEDYIRNDEEFYLKNCGSQLESWAYLSKYNNESWFALGDRFEISNLERFYTIDTPIIVNLDKWGFDMCDSFRVEVINRMNDSVVWQQDRSNSCVVLDPAKYTKFSYKVTTKTNPLPITEIGDYYLDVYVQDDHVRGYFTITSDSQ